MLTTTIIKVERGVSKKDNKPFTVAWFTGDKGLPIREFCPAWCEDGMKVNVYIVPNYQCRARVEFEQVK